jgi:glyoxylase-like metal-dependent hydrolase (beta-lactamase superfamily II)/8-oxo-dGTP pyrophosphatase MutT (NUDIX family)
MGTAAPLPRLAATLVLVRDSPNGPEALLTKRPERLRFMGGATVFPGGAVDDADLDPRWERASALTRAEAAGIVGEPDAARSLGFLVCALREAFEEVGWIDLDGDGDGPSRSDANDGARWLNRCLSDGVVLRTDRLVPAGRWVTPEGAPVRFDACFFVARAHPGWEPAADPREVDEAWWSTPERALEQLASGELLMAPPTVEMLQRLAGHGDVDAALRSLGARSAEGLGADRLSPFVQVVVAPNPGVMTGPGTNTYVVGADPSVVIDPAVDDADYLRRVLHAAGRVTQILITHRHSDHVGGAAAVAEATGAPVRAFGDAPAGAARVEPLVDEEVIEAGSARLVALHTPGHASDHLCYYLDGTTSLFSGDAILGQGTAVIAPPDGDMSAYLDSLHRLLAWRIGRIYPGHWPALDGGRVVIERYIAHRMERAAAIKEAIREAPATIEEIVGHVYADTPVHLHPIAAYSVQAHLAMLEATGEVRRVNERWAQSDVE